MDNQHKLIQGYRDLTAEEIAVMNTIKAAEAEVDKLFIKITNEYLHHGSEATERGDRWLRLARSSLETGFMYLIKAVAQPTTGLGSI